MSYTSLDILKERYGARLLVELTDREAVATGAIDTDTVDQAIADAAATIDGYLANRYKLPLATTPSLIAKIAHQLVIYDLHLYTPDEKIKDGHDAAMRQLREISAGTLRIPGAAGIEPASTGGDGARVTDRERPLTAQSLKGFI